MVLSRPDRGLGHCWKEHEIRGVLGPGHWDSSSACGMESVGGLALVWGGGCQAEGGAGPRCAFVWVGRVPGVWDGPGPLCRRVCLGEEPAVCTPAECLLPLTNRLPLCRCCQV